MSSRLAGSDGSRPASRQLNPSHDDAHDDDHNDNHNAFAMEHLLKGNIVVKPHPTTLSAKPRSLQPLMLLPRRHLQLSFLDLAAPSGSFEFSRFYDAQVKLLDLEARIGAEPKILVARLDYDKTVYALERQETGLYTLCKLSSGVDLVLLSQDASIISLAALKKRKATGVQQAEPQPVATTASHHESKKRRLAIEAIQSLVKKPARLSFDGAVPSLEEESQPPPAAGAPEAFQPITAEAEVPMTAEPVPAVPRGNTLSTKQLVAEDVLAQPDAETILDGIRSQYQEALYHSRGSLAYFAKGPLSRARAAFHLDCDAKLELVDLVEYLKTLVMTTVQIDKKYREIVPDIMAKCKNDLAPDSEEEKSAPKVRKRKAKKMKLSKDGLYPDDDGHIRKWWVVRRPKPKHDDASAAGSPQEIRWEISYLRSRETQLQMIIILEILSLQPLCTSENGLDSQQPPLPGDDDGVEEISQTVKKKRNRHNLPFLLDVHADRLTIWHSTALDDINMANSTDGHNNVEGQNELQATADPLKDFCVDIIVPFFSARLPEQCETINRKLGGPVMIPPQKLRTKTKRPDASVVKPGAKSDTTMRRTGSGGKSSLENVLSKEFLQHRRSMSRGPGGMIALMRSVSTPSLPAMKREASEPAGISKIPREDEGDNAIGLEPPRAHGARRNLDNGRVRKDAHVHAELKNAITALRRPNRDVVGQAMVEDAERRATTTLSQLKKSRKPQMHPRVHSVVKATPATSRFRDVLGRDPINQPTFASISEDIDSYDAPSSASMVPSSGPRKQRRSMGMEEHGRSTKRSRADQVEATPAKPTTTRPFDVPSSAPEQGCVLTSSPVMSRKIAQPRFLEAGYRANLSHRDSGISIPSSPGVGLMETPVKRSAPSMANFVTITPIKRSADIFVRKTPAAVVEAVKPKSVYAQLGWDDDDDDELR